MRHCTHCFGQLTETHELQVTTCDACLSALREAADCGGSGASGTDSVQAQTQVHTEPEGDSATAPATETDAEDDAERTSDSDIWTTAESDDCEYCAGLPENFPCFECFRAEKRGSDVDADADAEEEEST